MDRIRKALDLARQERETPFDIAPEEEPRRQAAPKAAGAAARHD